MRHTLKTKIRRQKAAIQSLTAQANVEAEQLIACARRKKTRLPLDKVALIQNAAREQAAVIDARIRRIYAA